MYVSIEYKKNTYNYMYLSECINLYKVGIGNIV